MPGTFHSYLSSRSQRRSASLVFSEPRRPVTSTRERTDIDSTVYLPDPNGPPWHIHLLQKLCRDKRLGDIPGWFDRWDVFLGVNDLANSILSVSNEPEQAALRRGVWLGVVLHSAFVAMLLAMGVYLPVLASLIRDVFHNAWHRLALYTLLVLEIVLVKVTFDLWLLRRLFFLCYSVTLGTLLASMELESHLALVFYCYALAIVPQLVILVLSGVQRKVNGDSAVFLGHVSSGLVSAIITTIVVISIHYSFGSPGPFLDRDHVALVVLALVAIAFIAAFEASLLFRTLARDEIWLAVYYVHFDLHVVTLLIPLVLLAMVVGGVLGLAIGAPIEMLRQVYSNVWDFYSGGSTFGLIWHLDCLRRRTARVQVDIDVGSDATSQETKENE